MRQSNGCSTPAPKSSAAKQWIKELAQKKEDLALGSNPMSHLLAQTFFGN